MKPCPIAVFVVKIIFQSLVGEDSEKGIYVVDSHLIVSGNAQTSTLSV